MGKHLVPAATREWWTLRELQKAVERNLLLAGFPSDDDLDRRVGLDTPFSMRDAPRLLAEREAFGMSARDVAELFVYGWLSPEDHGIDEAGLVYLLDATRRGSHHRNECN